MSVESTHLLTYRRIRQTSGLLDDEEALIEIRLIHVHQQHAAL